MAQDCIEQTVMELTDTDSDKEHTDRSSDDNNVIDTMESKQFKEFNILIKHINENQHDYDAYLKLCDIAIEIGNLNYVRKAYEKFADIYPLSSKIWLKYLNVLIPLKNTETERIEICKIFKMALSDYYAIDVAIECANYISNPENIEIGNNLWLDLDTVYGLHYEHGHDIFTKKRQSICNNNNLTFVEKVEKTLEVFCQEMSYPLNLLEECYASFKRYQEENKEIIATLNNQILADEILLKYEMAKKLRKKLRKFEEILCEVNERSEENSRKRAEIFLEYLDCLRNLCNEDNFDIVILHQLSQITYERLVSEFFMIPDYWLMYIEYVDMREARKKFELPSANFYEQTSLAITIRSMRNCNSKDLYIKAMQLNERRGCTEKDIRELLEQSLSVGFTAPEPEVEIYLEYLSYLTRCTNYTIDEECVKLRKNFDWAWNYLGRRWGALADPNCEILQLWGKVEYEFFKNPKSGRELWTTVMSSSDNGSKSGLWIFFAQMEAQYNIKQAANLYSRALNQIKIDDPHSIVSSWKLFERTHGTLKSRSACYKTSALLIQRLTENKSKNEQDRAGNIVATPRRNQGTDKIHSMVVSTNHQHHSQLKRVMPESQNTEPMTNVKKLKLSSDKDLKMNDLPIQPHIYKTETDNSKGQTRTVFLSNIDYQITEEDIRIELSKYLKINNIELRRSSNGKSRGFGFMELINPSEVIKALKLDRYAINGRPIYISHISNDRNQRKKFKYATGAEPKKLFIKNLPVDCTKEELENMLKGFGKLNEVRLVYHKSGTFKQIAFAEYENESDACKALIATNNMLLRDNKLVVAISNPSLKISTPNLVKSPIVTKKPRLMLIPSVVRQTLKSRSSNAGDNNHPSSSPTLMKTNDDFRKLL